LFIHLSRGAGKARQPQLGLEGCRKVGGEKGKGYLFHPKRKGIPGLRRRRRGREGISGPSVVRSEENPGFFGLDVG